MATTRTPAAPWPTAMTATIPSKNGAKVPASTKPPTAGSHFTKLTKGLPTNNLGRIGIEYYRKNPDTVFAIVDCEKIGMGTPRAPVHRSTWTFPPKMPKVGPRVTGIRENGPSAKAGLLVDDLIQTVNDERITSQEKLDEVFREHKIGDKLA